MDGDVEDAGGLPIDPCPNGHIDLLERLAARLEEEVLTEPWEPPQEPWQFTDRGLLAELRRAQRDRSSAEARWLATSTPTAWPGWSTVRSKWSHQRSPTTPTGARSSGVRPNSNARGS